jgi:hypothetical protein
MVFMRLKFGGRFCRLWYLNYPDIGTDVPYIITIGTVPGSV